MLLYRFSAVKKKVLRNEETQRMRAVISDKDLACTIEEVSSLHHC